MDSEDHVILEISSDEDGDLDESGQDIDWLSELLDGANEAEESDEVMVVEEDSCVSSMQRQKSTHADARKTVSGDGLDDDCLILDGDPDNQVPLVDDTGDGSDELLIVGEKGPLACRDYPHPRHLCATFPFSTTPHEKYCDQCHCYVCDLRAPCIYWGTGVSGGEHCHSTDKEEVWKIQKKCFKQGIIATPPVRKVPDTTLSMAPAMPNLLPTRSLSESLSLNSISVQSSVAKSSQPRVCLTPNILNHRNNNRSRPVHGSNRLSQYPSRSLQLMPVTQNVRRERSVAGGGLHSQFVTSQSKFKRTGSSGSSFRTVNQSGYGSSDNIRKCTSMPSKNHSSTLSPWDDIDFKRWQDVLYDSLENSASIFTDLQPTVSSQQGSNQSVPQQNENQNMYVVGNQAPNAATDQNPLGFDYDWLKDTSQSIPQHPSAVDPQLLSIQNAEPPVTVADFSGPETTPGSSEYLPENWMYSLDHQSVPETYKDPVLSQMDFIPPQQMTADPTLLVYDFDNTWSGLAHI